MIIMAKTKYAVFTMAFRLKNGISELLTVKSNNFVMPNTMPLWNRPPKRIPITKAPKQESRFSAVSRDSIVDFR